LGEDSYSIELGVGNSWDIIPTLWNIEYVVDEYLPVENPRFSWTHRDTTTLDSAALNLGCLKKTIPKNPVAYHQVQFVGIYEFINGCIIWFVTN
jgi:hypothetical protein